MRDWKDRSEEINNNNKDGEWMPVMVRRTSEEKNNCGQHLRFALVPREACLIEGVLQERGRWISDCEESLREKKRETCGPGINV